MTDDPLAGIKIIDCDTHWQEPADLWTSRVPPKYKDLMPQVRRVSVEEARRPHEFIGPGGILGPNNLPQGSETADRSDLVAEGEIDRWYVGDRDFGWMTLWINKDGVKNRTTERIPTIEAADPGSWDAKSRLAAMDRMGIYAHIMYPNVAGFGPAKSMLAWDDNKLRNMFVSTYNDALAEVCQESEGRLFGNALTAVWDKDDLVREAERSVELGLKGFILGDRPELLGLPDYRDPYWEGFWDLCNQTGLPLNFHIGNSHGGFHYNIPWSSYRRDAARAISTTMLMMFNAGCMANFLLSGLFDRYPNLKFVSVESGVGWIPYVLEQLDYQIDQTVTEAIEREMIGKRSPIEYFRDHFYSMFWSEKLPIRTKEVREWLGVKNILFETDYPHYTSLYPSPRDHLVEVTKDMDDYTKRRILQDNAVELFQLPIS